MIVQMKPDGTVEEVVSLDCEVFANCRKLVGGFLEPLYLDRNGLVMFVDEDGYAKQLPVNKAASLIYNKVFHAEHFILGTVAFAYIDRIKEEFVNIPVGKAVELVAMLEQFARDAEKVEVPYPLPEPKVEIIGFESTEQMMEYLKGGRLENHT